jgi:hypothetical protein
VSRCQHFRYLKTMQIGKVRFRHGSSGNVVRPEVEAYR